VDPATAIPGCVTVTRLSGEDITSSVTDLALDTTRRRLTITFANALPDGDTYVIALTHVLRSESGAQVGEGVALTVSALAGDANASGEVTAADALAVRQAAGRLWDNVAAACDVDNSGRVTGADMLAVRSRIGHKL
jgi:hypothetical protein